jgi:hypothetical protein
MAPVAPCGSPESAAGVRPVARFENRYVATNRIWRQLSSSDTKQPSPRGSGSRRRASKAQRVLRMLRRPEGVTLTALVQATKWQPHTVRGFLSRKMARELALRMDSFRRDGERVYHIGEQPFSGRE